MYIFKCPHCNGMICVRKCDLNCKIFRHGVMKGTMTQINPHASKEICDKLSAEDKIYGCGKPFKITILKNKIACISICKYI
jgi:hypothetical protein